MARCAAISMPSGAGPGSTGSIEVDLHVPEMADRSQAPVREHRRGRAIGGVDRVAKPRRRDPRPAPSRLVLRSDRRAPNRCRAPDARDERHPTTRRRRHLPDRSARTRRSIGWRRGDPAVGRQIEGGSAPDLSEKMRVDRGLDVVGALVGEQHRDHRVKVLLGRRTKRVAIGWVHDGSVHWRRCPTNDSNEVDDA